MKRQHYQMIMAVLLTSLPCLEVWAKKPVLSELERARIMHDAWASQTPAVVGKHIGKAALKDMDRHVNNSTRVNVANEISKAFKQKVTYQAKAVRLSEFVGSIARATGLQALLSKDVEDRLINVDAKEQSVDQLMRYVLYPLSYGFKVQNNNLIILAEETRVFRLVLPPADQSFTDTTSNESFVAPQGDASGAQSGVNQQVKLGSKVLVENSSQGLSFWSDVESNLKVLVSKEGSFSLNKPAGSVVVTDKPLTLDKIAAYIEDLNKRVAQQIEVDVKVVEVSFSDEDRLGVDWNVLAQNLKTFNSLGLATNFSSGNFTGGNYFTFSADGPHDGSGVNRGGVKFVLDALAKQGKVEVVSQPRVVMLNNQVSIIQVGSTQSYVDSSKIETTQVGTTVSLTTSQVQEGVTMRLLGNIVGDQVFLSVTPVVTTIDNIRSITSGNTTIEAPQTTTKSINTLVKLNEGETVAIGGLITSSLSKTKEAVPVLSKLPLLGRLFEYNSKRQGKSELIIFITPKRV